MCACWQLGVDNKGALAGKGIFDLEKKIYPTLLSAPKACIVSLKRWHKKATIAKVQKNDVVTYIQSDAGTHNNSGRRKPEL